MISFLAHKADIMRKTDPDHIYVENIRSFFNMPHRIARLMCEMAVREGVLEKMIGLKCPKCHRIIQSLPYEDVLPETLSCIICEMNEEEEFVYNVQDLQQVIYYRLKR